MHDGDEAQSQYRVDGDLIAGAMGTSRWASTGENFFERPSKAPFLKIFELHSEVKF